MASSCSRLPRVPGPAIGRRSWPAGTSCAGTGVLVRPDLVSGAGSGPRCAWATCRRSLRAGRWGLEPGAGVSAYIHLYKTASIGQSSVMDGSPFIPGAGHRPPFLAGRDELLRDWRSGVAGTSSQGRLRAALVAEPGGDPVQLQAELGATGLCRPTNGPTTAATSSTASSGCRRRSTTPTWRRS